MILLGQLFNCLPGSPKISLADVEQFVSRGYSNPLILSARRRTKAVPDARTTKLAKICVARPSASTPDGSSKLTHMLIGVGEFAGRTRGYSAQFLQTINP